MLTFTKCTKAPYILCTMPQTQAQQDIEPNFSKEKTGQLKFKLEQIKPKLVKQSWPVSSWLGPPQDKDLIS
jgi:hypothetical protein